MFQHELMGLLCVTDLGHGPDGADAGDFDASEDEMGAEGSYANEVVGAGDSLKYLVGNFVERSMGLTRGLPLTPGTPDVWSTSSKMTQMSCSS